MARRKGWINPVLEKEIRLRMRTVRSPVAIFVYLLTIGLLALGFVYMNMGSFSGRLSTGSSSNLFYFLSGAQLVLISFMTPGLTAGVISGEREKQTLNMLLTTQQSSSTIILSKLLASISFMLLTVVATMPVYSIVFLYGGVSPKQLLSVFAYFAFVMVMLGSVGVCFSTLLKKTIAAVIATYGFVVFIYGFTAIAALFFGEIWGGSRRVVMEYILSLNPMMVLISLMDSGNAVISQHTVLQVWHLHVMAYTLVVAAALFLSIRYLRPVLKKKKA